MSKTVTLRLSDNVYSLFCACAESDNRSLSNFIETSALQHLREHEYVDDLEMAEINSDKALQKRLRRAYRNVKARRIRLVR